MQELTSASEKSIGFDYQYYYFLYLLLSLRKGEAIGIEIKDDIHIDLPDNTQVLIQLKHSLQTNTQGETKNLTERDEDLWKTFANWIKVISDPQDGRKIQQEQLEYIEKTRFILVSNKASNNRNQFLANMVALSNRSIDIRTFRQYLQQLHDKTKDPKKPTESVIKDYMNLLLAQEDRWIESFVRKVDFELDQDDLINKIKIKIEEKIVSPTRIDFVFESLDSNLRQLIYLNVKNRKKETISFEEFKTKFRNCFDAGRSRKLPMRHPDIVLPDRLEEQTFIKQLVDIEELDQDDMATMIQYTTYKLRTYNNIEQWLQDGELSITQKDSFDKEAILKWENIFRAKHRKSKMLIKAGTDFHDLEEAIKCDALNCLDEVRKLELIINETDLETEMSNGQYYLLSDKPQVGWLLDWESRYKK